MTIEKVYAQLSCTDLNRSKEWFKNLFGRSSDASPMDGLLEWHHRDNAGFQLFEDAANAGRGTMTLIVGDLKGEHSRLTARGLNPPDIDSADTVSLIRLRDPDRNLVVLAQPGPV